MQKLDIILVLDHLMQRIMCISRCTGMAWPIHGVGFENYLCLSLNVYIFLCWLTILQGFLTINIFLGLNMLLIPIKLHIFKFNPYKKFIHF